MKFNKNKLALFIITLHGFSYLGNCFANSLTGINLTGSSMSGTVELDTSNYVMSDYSFELSTGFNLTGYSISTDDEVSQDDVISNPNANSDDDEVLSPSVKKKAKAIEGFRDRKQNIINGIYQNTNVGMLMDIEAAGKQLQNLSTDFKDIEKDFEKVQARKNKVDEKYSQLRDTIKQILENINQTKLMVNQRIEKINAYTKKIIDLREQVSSLEKEIESTKSYLVNYTNLLYKINNDYYGNDLNIDDIKLLAKSQNIAQSLSTEDIIKSLSVKLDELLQIMKERHQSYLDFSQQINDIRVKYKYEVEKYKNEIDTMTQQKKYLLDLLKYMKEEKLNTDEEYNNLFESQNSIKDQISNLISISKSSVDNIKLGTGGIDLSPLVKIKERDDSDRYFSWPVLPVKRITTFYNDPDYKKSFGVDHKGLDLASSQGNNVYAPANGIVYKVVDQDSIGLNWMIVIHKYGYITVYLHMNRIVVKEGDFVKRGQLIGLSGGTPGTRGAGLLSTGPHLHYEILKNGESVDPLEFTDLSVIKSKNMLQSKYNIKYVRDRYARKVNLTNIKYIEGETLQERRRAFLNKYAFGPYSDLSLWEDAAKVSNVDIDLGICIGFAETGLGYNLASRWNVGNVGNNDRGNRVGFDSPLQGASAIYMGLSNKYLSRHHSLDQLSRFGNQEGPLYASSPFNWEKNIIMCLSKIKGYRVPEDYPFRVYTPNSK